jgi:hypothetical protein
MTQHCILGSESVVHISHTIVQTVAGRKQKPGMNSIFLVFIICLVQSFSRELDINVNPKLDRSSLHSRIENPESVHALPGYDGELKSKHFSGKFVPSTKRKLFITNSKNSRLHHTWRSQELVLLLCPK